MIRRPLVLVLCMVAATTACKVDTTNPGTTDVIPLVRVDNLQVPVSLATATSSTVQILSGTLTSSDLSISCDWTVNLSTGAKLKGSTSCLAGSVGQIANGVRLDIDLATTGAPSGTHSYDFVASVKSCTCGRECGLPACVGDRLVPEALRIMVPDVHRAPRVAGTRSGESNGQVRSLR